MVPVQEVGPIVVVWHHPRGATPTFELPIPDEHGWGRWRVQRLDLPVHPQHVMQDLADVSHFETIHRYSQVTPCVRTTAEGPRLTFAAEIGWDTGVGFLPWTMRFHSISHGLGYQVTEVHDPNGIMASRHLLMPSPVDDHTTRLFLAVQTRLGERSRQWSGAVEPMLNAALGRYVNAHFRRDVLRDATLWTRRVHLPKHTPPDDEAHATFERWLGQFEA